jgi:hypothetical protein
MNKSINLGKLDSVKELNLCELTSINGGSWWRIYYNSLEHFIVEMLVDAYNNPIRPSEYR